LFHIVGRFQANGMPAATSGPRKQRTSRDGWRLDWPRDVEPNVPYWDNVPRNSNPKYPPHSTPWIPGKPGTFFDPAEIHKNRQKFIAHACFVGEKEDGSSVLLGCLKWGFELTASGQYKKDRRTIETRPKYKVLDGTLSFSCKLPEGGQGAIDAWNDQLGLPEKHEMPVLR
jgi:hypothetical protein